MTKLIDGLAKRIDELRDSQKQTEGVKQAASEIKGDSNSHQTLVLGIIGVVITLILGVTGSVVAAIGLPLQSLLPGTTTLRLPALPTLNNNQRNKQETACRLCRQPYRLRCLRCRRRFNLC
jgi:hypothetical protein